LKTTKETFERPFERSILNRGKSAVKRDRRNKYWNNPCVAIYIYIIYISMYTIYTYIQLQKSVFK